MSAYNSKLYPEPDKRDAVKMKEFFSLKYKQKRFAQKDESDDESDGSDSEDEKKKKKKKEEKKKEKKKKQKKESSDEERSASEESDGAEKQKKKGTGKLMAPPTSGKTVGLKKPPSVESHNTNQGAPQVMNFLEMDTAPVKTEHTNSSVPASGSNDGWSSWATFDQPKS